MALFELAATNNAELVLTNTTIKKLVNANPKSKKLVLTNCMSIVSIENYFLYI